MSKAKLASNRRRAAWLKLGSAVLCCLEEHFSRLSRRQVAALTGLTVDQLRAIERESAAKIVLAAGVHKLHKLHTDETPLHTHD